MKLEEKSQQLILVYLVAFKKKGMKKSILKYLISNAYGAGDAANIYIFYFDKNGVYERNFSKNNSDFIQMSWEKIENFDVIDESRNFYVTFLFEGQNYKYEIPKDGRIMEDNVELFDGLIKKNWNKFKSFILTSKKEVFFGFL